VPSAIAIALGAAMAILLWVYAGRLAGWMLADSSGVGASAGPATASIQSIALSLIGIIIAVNALPAAALYVVGVLVFKEDAVPGIGALFQMVLGAGLFLGANGLSHLWYRARTAGLLPPDESNRPTAPDANDPPP
jgi:hypothetical protein